MLLTLGLAVGPAASAQVEVSNDATLREAFADPAATEVSLDADVELSDCDEGALSRPAGAADLVVTGGGHTITQTCDGVRVIDNGGGALVLVDLAVTGGSLDAGAEVATGGGIWSQGPLTLDGVTVSGNRADGDLGGLGGGVAGAGALTIVDSTVSGNVAGGGVSVFGGRGGGVSAGGLLTIEASEVSDNVAAGAPSGGGQAGGASGQGHVLVVESTLAGNEAEAGAETGSGSMGALAADGDLAIENTTVSGNVAAGDAGLVGGVTAAGAVHVAYSTIVGNEAATRAANLAVSFAGRVFASVITDGAGGAPGCAVSGLVSEGFNAADTDTCGFDAGSDLAIGDAGLADLADNGGQTRTHALADDSPLLDAVPDGSCQDGLGAGVVSDQRGQDRPAGDGCDIGAYERTAPDVDPTPTPSPTTTPTPSPAPTATPSPTPSPTVTAAPSPSAAPSASQTPAGNGRPGGRPPHAGPPPGSVGNPFEPPPGTAPPPPSPGGPLAYTGIALGILALVAAATLGAGHLAVRIGRRRSEGGGS